MLNKDGFFRMVIVPVFFAFIIVFFFIIVPLCFWSNKIEINPSDYHTVKSWIEEYPELKPSVKEKIKDGFINHKEYNEIKQEFNAVALKRAREIGV